MAAMAAMAQVADSGRWRMEVGQSIRGRLDERWVRAAQDRNEAQALVFAMLLAVEGGRQTCLMAPTEILAEQHARGIATMLEPLGQEH